VLTRARPIIGGADESHVVESSLVRRLRGPIDETETTMLLNAYLIFPVTCREAFTFYQSVLGGHLDLLDHSAMGDQVPADWKDKILHAHLAVGDATILGSDRPGEPAKAEGYSVAINVDTVEEAARVFNGLAVGGSIEMPLSETFFAKSFGVLTDRFGTP
jgi:PhnB protein